MLKIAEVALFRQSSGLRLRGGGTPEPAAAVLCGHPAGQEAAETPGDAPDPALQQQPDGTAAPGRDSGACGGGCWATTAGHGTFGEHEGWLLGLGKPQDAPTWIKIWGKNRKAIHVCRTCMYMLKYPKNKETPTLQG